jgi:hypothetical protein
LHISKTNVAWPIEQIPLVYCCPYCHATDAAERAYETYETAYFFIRHRTDWLKCRRYGGTALSRISLIDLAAKDVADCAREVVRYRSLPSRLTVLLAIALCWFPFLGLIRHLCRGRHSPATGPPSDHRTILPGDLDPLNRLGFVRAHQSVWDRFAYAG